jgi:hypothetical protein
MIKSLHAIGKEAQESFQEYQGSITNRDTYKYRIISQALLAFYKATSDDAEYQIIAAERSHAEFMAQRYETHREEILWGAEQLMIRSGAELHEYALIDAHLHGVDISVNNPIVIG